MRKLSMLAGVAVVAVGLTSLSVGTASAAGCLDPNNLPPMSLSHDSMVPGAGFGFNKSAYDDQLAKGNTCGVTQQSYSTDRDLYQSYPNNPGTNPDQTSMPPQ